MSPKHSPGRNRRDLRDFQRRLIDLPAELELAVKRQTLFIVLAA